MVGRAQSGRTRHRPDDVRQVPLFPCEHHARISCLVAMVLIMILLWGFGLPLVRSSCRDMGQLHLLGCCAGMPTATSCTASAFIRTPGDLPANDESGVWDGLCQHPLRHGLSRMVAQPEKSPPNNPLRGRISYKSLLPYLILVALAPIFLGL